MRMWMSQCGPALWRDIWRVMSLDGLWIQYTQADGDEQQRSRCMNRKEMNNSRGALSTLRLWYKEGGKRTSHGRLGARAFVH